jgi:hypothetical protein
MRIMPAVYDWKVKRKVFRWYRELKAVELEARNHLDALDTAELLERLEEIEDGVDHTEVPLTYWDYVYALRGHIELVRAKLLRDPVKPAVLSPPPE